MLWVLWDIVLPLIGAFLTGLIVGWLLWRWRRSRISSDNISELRRSSSRYRADAERLQQSNIELSDRLQAASGAGGGELASAKKRIDMLGEELKSSRREVAELKSSAKGGGRAVGASAPGTSGTVSAIKSDSELHREIESRDRMIATLKQSLDQFGDSGDNTALMADVALRDRKIDALEKLLENNLLDKNSQKK